MCVVMFLLAWSSFYCEDLCKAIPISEGLLSAVALVSVAEVACDEAEAVPSVSVSVLPSGRCSHPQLTARPPQGIARWCESTRLHSQLQRL